MKKYINFLMLFLAFIFFSCKGDTTEPENDNFTGITETGPNGSEPTGKIDNDDWRMVAVSGNVFDDIISDFPSMAFHPAYPNPTKGNIVNLVFSVSRKSEITMYLCDKPGNIVEYIFDKQDMNPGEYVKQYTFNENSKHGIYRFFLEIISPSAKYKSYGDVQFSE